MTLNELEKYFEDAQTQEIEFVGKCHVCGKPVAVVVRIEDDGKVIVSGGAVYKPWTEDNTIFLKCETCYVEDPVLRKYQPCEVYSRIVGYFRPVKQWNLGKKEEFWERATFSKEVAV